MVEIKRETGGVLRELFPWSNESLLESFYDNQFGEAFADDEQSPTCAVIYVTEFAFLAGDAASPAARELVAHFPKNKALLAFLPENDAWADLIKEIWSGKYEVWNRFAIKKEGDVFDREKLREYARSLDGRYVIKRIDGDLYDKCMAHEQFKDFCSNFNGKEDFLKRGVGFVAIDGENIAGGASSFTVYNKGIEIEVDTGEAYRRQGIAAACSATLMLHCLENGLYPSWDAANITSVRLSERLGYHFDHEYLVYAVKSGEKQYV